MEGMQLEHCAMYGHNVPFVSPNYGITTTPATEWAIVVLNAPTPHMGHGRRLRPLAEAMEERPVDEAKLNEAEVVAVILYTGPRE